MTDGPQQTEAGDGAGQQGRPPPARLARSRAKSSCPSADRPTGSRGRTKPCRSGVAAQCRRLLGRAFSHHSRRLQGPAQDQAPEAWPGEAFPGPDAAEPHRLPADSFGRMPRRRIAAVTVAGVALGVAAAAAVLSAAWAPHPSHDARLNMAAVLSSGVYKLLNVGPPQDRPARHDVAGIARTLSGTSLTARLSHDRFGTIGAALRGRPLRTRSAPARPAPVASSSHSMVVRRPAPAYTPPPRLVGLLHPPRASVQPARPARLAPSRPRTAKEPHVEPQPANGRRDRISTCRAPVGADGQRGGIPASRKRPKTATVRLAYSVMSWVRVL